MSPLREPERWHRTDEPLIPGMEGRTGSFIHGRGQPACPCWKIWGHAMCVSHLQETHLPSSSLYFPRPAGGPVSPSAHTQLGNLRSKGIWEASPQSKPRSQTTPVQTLLTFVEHRQCPGPCLRHLCNTHCIHLHKIL